MKEINKDKLLIYSAPFILLLLLILSFGLMLPWLGYGFDEWHFIYYSTRGSEGLTELFHYDGHPQATWSYIQSFNILGYTPFHWHIYSLLWRWSAVVSFWLCLIKTWPNNHRQNFVIAALFAIYPIFTLQVFPISYFEIWIAYTLLFLSFFFTILAVQIPERKLLFTVVAFILNVSHVFTREYAWFVELMRFIFIWINLSPKGSLQKQILQTFKIWFPFFIVFTISIIWRGFFYTPLRKFFQVQPDLFTNPIETLLIWGRDLLPDISIVLFTSWYKIFSAEYVYFFRPFNIALFILFLLIFIAGVFYVRKIDNVSSNATDNWITEAVFLGLPSILFGILPFYIASYSIHLTDTPHNSRLAIGMLPGAALIITAIIEIVISKPNLRVLFTMLLISLSVVWHIRYTNDFKKVWEYQSNFLQQLTWRIPGIEKNTAIYVWQPSLPEIDNSDANIALYGDFALSMAINSIYQQNPNPTENRLSYWYYSDVATLAEMTQDVPIYSEHATTYFDGNASDNIFFYYDPQNDRCLHLIASEDTFYKQYPDLIKEVAPYTTTDRISQSETQNLELRDDILSPDQNSWCFYYQKAELARQYQQWDEIRSLWQNVVDNNLRTKFGTEYIPFIDGFAHLNEWRKAKEITFSANRISKAIDSILCPLWEEIELSTKASDERNIVIDNVEAELACAE